MTENRDSPAADLASDLASDLAVGRVLIVMRHAKSDWGDDSLSDHERPLNRRGQRDAPRMAQWLAEIGFVPDTILSSNSERTHETVALMTEQWSSESRTQVPTQSFTQSLYLASPDTIASTVRSDACDAKIVMVVAHNPGIANVVSRWAEQGMEMPTAAIAIFDLGEIDWSELRTCAPLRLLHAKRPKEL